ncbi:MAG: MATE family efflux transporter [Sarcina sp.]
MKKDLTKGNIASGLLGLAGPIVLTNFIQTAYSMVDMIWIGRLGSDAVAAVGTASIFTNFAFSIFTLITIGTTIKLSHSIGAKKEHEAKSYIDNAIILTIILAILLISTLIILRKPLIAFYNLGSEHLNIMAEHYLIISSLGILFMYFNSLFSSVFNAYGNSKIPFKTNTIGFILNIVLDPILIFGFGTNVKFGIIGAAFATLIARILVFILFILFIKKDKFSCFGGNIKFDFARAKEVVKIGIPVTAQRVAFNLITVYMSRIVSDYGSIALAVQRVGIQIESISFMTAAGLQGAVSAFVGQNYGAKKYERIRKGYNVALFLTLIFGGIIGLLFMIFPSQIFSIFLDTPESLDIGKEYMRIIGFSQLFMCLEIFTVGAFNGMGKTYIPPIIAVSLTLLRIPVALFLSSTALGLNGVWFSISVTSVLKGVILVTGFLIFIKKFMAKKQLENNEVSNETLAN